jgi:type IV secretion system protein VirB1
MFAAIGLMACPNLAVSAEVMSHIVDVESGANPYAIGVVGGQLERQPKNLAEALATVHMLDAKGYNYSLGVAQVNRANLGKYGLDSYEKAFDACPNLAAGAQILAACYASSGGDWGKAFSCYYSGDFVTGYRDGYVQKVYDSINRSMGVDNSQAIPLKSTATPPVNGTDKLAMLTPGSPGYRVAIRSVSFSPIKTYQPAVGPTPLSQDQAVAAPAAAAQLDPAAKVVAALPTAATTKAVAPPANGPPNNTADSSIFEPQVTGPNDSAVAAVQDKPPVQPSVDKTDLRVRGQDAAFVF